MPDAKKKYVRCTAEGRIVARADGPGAFLYKDEVIDAGLVNENTLREIKTGGKASRTLEIVELTAAEAAGHDPGIAETASPVSPEGGNENPNQRSGRIDPNFTPVGQKVDDVMDYLKETSPEEVARVQELEAANTERQGGPSKTVANYEPPKEG